MQTAALDLSAHSPRSAYDYGERSSGEIHGVVLTRPHVVNLILDLSGYTLERDLASFSLLEPSCGHGAFLVPAVERLIVSARLHGRSPEQLQKAIRAYDIDPEHVAAARRAVSGALLRYGFSLPDAASLAEAWIQEGDFLLADEGRRFDVVVGNPPYIRIEQLSPELSRAYRARFTSLYDRADLYVAFIERGLHLLSPEGVLSFICADRWILNRYGAPLRRLLSDRFRVRWYIDLHDASPFESEVIAYPSIFSISRGVTSRVQVATLKTASPEECEALRQSAGGAPASEGKAAIAEYSSWFEGDDPWVLSTPEHLHALRALEARFAPLEGGGGAKVGIGVATGNDRVYIVDEGADIEPDRLVPLLMREDIEGGLIKDARRWVINTFQDDGKVVDLGLYPRLARYLDAHAEEIKRRHIAKRSPASWFRTIDRVYPARVSVPKLLIPDIAGANEVVLDPGRFYPHHNLYFITSASWDMEALGGLLSSRVALFFVWSYAVKMRGGYLRFQAQYLRRIRLPSPSDLPPALTQALGEAFRKRDFAALDELALEAYDLASLPAFDFVDTRR